jgi:sirohydrochlorin ferrochelatase
MNQATILLVDNGSKRPDATLNLRRLATALSARAGLDVRPVSLQHADAIPVDELDGMPAKTFVPFLQRQLDKGQHEFVVLPLFFGPSRALTSFIPDSVGELRKRHPAMQLRVADVLCPLPAGEPRLVQILRDHIHSTMQAGQVDRARIVLVDHGSPIAEVTAVRQWLAGALDDLLADSMPLEQAVMERRGGQQYDFNGRLLATVLRQLAEADTSSPVVISMLFLSPGRHAGSGGDIAEICQQAADEHPGLRTLITPLVGDHPLLVDILLDRLQDAMSGPLSG